MTKLTTLLDLFLAQLDELHDGETQLLKALPRFAGAAHAPELRALLEEHLHETATHVQRLESILETFAQPARGTLGKAMQGLIEEASDSLEENAAPSVSDVALIAALQRIKLHEVSGYGTARTFAETLAYTEIAQLLQETLGEETSTDERLTQLAQMLNRDALPASEPPRPSF